MGGGRPSTEVAGFDGVEAEHPPLLPQAPQRVRADVGRPSWLDAWMAMPAPQTSIAERLTTPLPWEERVTDRMMGPGDEPLPAQSLSLPGDPGPARELPFPHYLQQQPVERDELGLAVPGREQTPLLNRRYLKLHDTLVDARQANKSSAFERMMLEKPSLVPNPPTRVSPTGRAPTMKMRGSTVTGTPPDEKSRALNFAKALGFDVSDGADEAAVTTAFKKATRGLSVAQLLSPKRLAKTKEVFLRHLDAARPPPVSRGPVTAIPAFSDD